MEVNESNQTFYNSQQNESKSSSNYQSENNSKSNQQNTIESTKNQIVEEPAFPGGYAALMKYIHQHLNYPKIDEINMNGGKVILVFYIETDGRISDINLVKGVTETMNAEALRIVKSMPNWIPGTIDGIKSRLKFTLPINFQLN
jgi:protein TonB